MCVFTVRGLLCAEGARLQWSAETGQRLRGCPISCPGDLTERRTTVLTALLCVRGSCRISVTRRHSQSIDWTPSRKQVAGRANRGQLTVCCAAASAVQQSLAMFPYVLVLLVQELGSSAYAPGVDWSDVLSQPHFTINNPPSSASLKYLVEMFVKRNTFLWKQTEVLQVRSALDITSEPEWFVHAVAAHQCNRHARSSSARARAGVSAHPTCTERRDRRCCARSQIWWLWHATRSPLLPQTSTGGGMSLMHEFHNCGCQSLEL